MVARKKATIEDLYRVPDKAKAELIRGEIVAMPPTGLLPGRAGGAIYASLRAYEKQVGGGMAIPDNIGFRVALPHRESFSPDAAFYTGRYTGMKFAEGAPVFAARIQSENDYGVRAEQELAAKRADYFAVGTLIVWDIDLQAEEVVRAYHANAPDAPQAFRRGEVAHAEPAVPGWRFPVDELFD